MTVRDGKPGKAEPIDFAPLGVRVDREGDRYVIDDAGAAVLSRVTAFLAERNIEPLDLRVGPPSLEDVFRRLTGDDT